MNLKKRTYILLTTILLGLNLPVQAQSEMLNLSLEGTLTMLRKADSFIADYSMSCSFKGDSASEVEDASRYLSLFESGSSEVIDDINPDWDPGSPMIIKESYKPVKQYVEEIRSQFREYNSAVIRSDAASAAERIYEKDFNTYISIPITKLSEGIPIDNSPFTYIQTESALVLVIRVLDTINYDMKISQILKGEEFGIDWDYELAKVEPKHVETHFYLTPLYSYLYPREVNNSYYPNRVIENSNEFFLYNYLDESDDLSSSIQGSAGINGEIEFRFFWIKPNKNKTKGFSIGIGGGLYNSYFQSDSYYEVRRIIDKDGDIVFTQTTLENFRESWMIVTADIPIKYSVEKWKNYRKGFYFSLGTRLSYVTVYANGTGDYSRIGYLPEYNVVLENLDHYGFVSNQPLDEKYKPGFEPFNLAAEISFGRKTKSKSGKLVFYTGLTFGAYLLNMLTPSENNFLFGYDDYSKQASYEGVLPMISQSNLGYIGLQLGIRKADPQENAKKRLDILRSPLFGTYGMQSYQHLTLRNIATRDFPDRDLKRIEDLSNKEDPVLFNQTSKDPRKYLTKYLNKRIQLSKDEEKRIRKTNNYVIRFSFVIDKEGAIREIKIRNQEKTEYGREVFRVLNMTAEHWEMGTYMDKPIDTFIEMEYAFK